MPELFENMSEDAKSAALLDYVKGRVDDSLRTQIHTAAKTNTNIAEEIAYYKGLENAVQKPAEAAPFDDLGWARLARDLDKEKPTSTIFEAANDNSRIWRYAAIALAFTAFGQAVFIALPDTSRNKQATYETVSEVSASYSLQVTFVPSAPEGAIRALFQKTGATITGGPSALGVYEVTFADEIARTKALVSFSATPEIVEAVYNK